MLGKFVCILRLGNIFRAVPVYQLIWNSEDISRTWYKCDRASYTCI